MTLEWGNAVGALIAGLVALIPLWLNNRNSIGRLAKLAEISKGLDPKHPAREYLDGAIGVLSVKVAFAEYGSSVAKKESDGKTPMVLQILITTFAGLLIIGLILMFVGVLLSVDLLRVWSISIYFLGLLGLLAMAVVQAYRQWSAGRAWLKDHKSKVTT